MGLARTAAEHGIAVLCRQHEEIRGLVHAVAAESTHERRRAFDLLCSRLTSHEALEDRLLRPVTRACVLGGELIAEARVAEEGALCADLAALADIDVSSAQFLAMFGGVSRRLIEHLESEELYEFPLVRTHRDEEALLAMEAVLRGTNLHPAAAWPPVNVLFGPIASAVGKVRGVVAAAVAPTSMLANAGGGKQSD